MFPNKNLHAHAPHLYRALPGPLPISITRAHLQQLSTHDFWVSEKSDGERAMLYVSKARASAYLIDRKFCVKQVRHTIYAELWGVDGDSLMDGELVVSKDHCGNTFMVFDVLVINGTRTLERKLSERLAHIGQDIVAPYRKRFPPATNTFEEQLAYLPLIIRAKAFSRKHHLKAGVMDFIKPVPGAPNEWMYDDGKRRNKNDGVIFTPEDDNYWCKKVPLLKWKHQGLDTIDFFTRSPWFDREGRLVLYSTANSLPEEKGARSQTVTVHMRSTRLTPEKRAWFLAGVSGKEGAIVEMQYDSQTSSWQPKNFRWDKATPNFMTTVLSTMETIIDNVQPADLYAACSKRPATTAAAFA